jgi:hypothetical protein
MMKGQAPIPPCWMIRRSCLPRCCKRFQGDSRRLSGRNQCGIHRTGLPGHGAGRKKTDDLIDYAGDFQSRKNRRSR